MKININIFIENILIQAKSYFKSLGLDENSISNLLKLGEESLKNHLSSLFLFFQKEDIKSLRETLHALEGVLLNMGLNSLALKIKEVHNLVKEGKVKEAENLFRKIISRGP